MYPRETLPVLQTEKGQNIHLRDWKLYYDNLLSQKHPTTPNLLQHSNVGGSTPVPEVVVSSCVSLSPETTDPSPTRVYQVRESLERLHDPLTCK